MSQTSSKNDEEINARNSIEKSGSPERTIANGSGKTGGQEGGKGGGKPPPRGLRGSEERRKRRKDEAKKGRREERRVNRKARCSLRSSQFVGGFHDFISSRVQPMLLDLLLTSNSDKSRK